ncbi:MAG: hypothetical protein ABSD10_01335 [Candidatus Saccharimonadales bacterium]|jgi:hypothetical protein
MSLSEQSGEIPQGGQILDWLVDAFPDTDWRENFLHHRRVWRAAKGAILDITTNGNYSELERNIYLQSARDTLFSARFQSSWAASMYLLTRNGSK